MTPQKLSTGEMIKQAVIAILIGAAINFIGQVSQGLIEVLRHVQVDAIAMGAGVGKYLWEVRTKLPYV